MKKIFLFSIALAYCVSVFSGNYPFPQNVQYVYGNKPSNAKSVDALNLYKAWKGKYVVDAGSGQKRVLFDGTNTVSEGIGYGMLLSAYADDQTLFDGLWTYYKSHANNHGVMNWKLDPNGNPTVNANTGNVEGANGATDADEDAAMALIIAHYQWGSGGTINYLSDAKTLINNIMTFEVELTPSANPTYVVKPGDVWGGSSVTNPSYLAPAYYKIFQIVTGDTRWTSVVNKSYDIIAANSDPTTGLVSDWSKADGTAAPGMGYNYTYDASRYPWRIETDYLWFGDSRAKTYLTRLANFVKNNIKSPSGVKDGYQKDGTVTGSSRNAVFTGTFAVALMVDPSYRSLLFSFYSATVGISSSDYFNTMIQCISLFVLTGNFYRLPDPQCQGPNLGPDLSLCNAPSYTLDPGLSPGGRNFKWSTGATTPTIQASKKGRYIVTMDSAGCVRRDTIFLQGLDVNLGPDKTIFVGQPVVLNEGANVNGVNYTWNTGATTPTITVDTAGIYWLQGDSSGCSDRDSIQITYINTTDIKVYPNPTSGRFNVLLLDPRAHRAEIEIYNVKGQFMGKQLFTLETGNVIPFDFSNFPVGMYILRIQTEYDRKTKKVVVD